VNLENMKGKENTTLYMEEKREFDFEYEIGG